MSESDKARQRREIQKGLMVDLMDLDDRAKHLQSDLDAWRRRWLASYQDLDDVLDGPPLG